MVQVPPAGTLVPQLLVCAKLGFKFASAVSMIEILTLFRPLFWLLVNVAIWTVLVVPVNCSGNDKPPGVNVTGKLPVPLRETS